MTDGTNGGERAGRDWVRAAGLLGVVFALSVLQPGVLVAVPLLLLLPTRGGFSPSSVLISGLAALLVVQGGRDAVWFAERAWALLVSGWFLALTWVAPEWRLSSRAMASVVGATLFAAGYFLANGEAWEAMDWAVSSGVMASVASTLAILREGQMASPAFVTAMYEMGEAQASVFPALLGLASMAALCVAWWIVARLRGPGEGAIGSAADFRFNDHLVWILIGGLILVLTRWGDVVSRLGANLVVFMGALYALRGAGVVLFVTGGLSAMAYVMLAMATVIAAPAVLGTAIVIGIGDTWLDVRSRATESAA